MIYSAAPHEVRYIVWRLFSNVGGLENVNAIVVLVEHLFYECFEVSSCDFVDSFSCAVESVNAVESGTIDGAAPTVVALQAFFH